MKMRKPLFGTLIVVLVLSISMLFAGTSVSAEEPATLAVPMDAAVQYTISTTATGGAPVITGASRTKVLQDGEDVIMSFDIVSGASSVYGDGQFGFLVGRPAGMPTGYPYLSSGMSALISTGGWKETIVVGTNGSTDREHDSSLTAEGYNSTNNNFKDGYSIKVVYHPYQNDSDKGTLSWYRKASANSDYILVTRGYNLSAADAGRDCALYFYAQRNAEFTITNYSITTTLGANLLTAEEETETAAYRGYFKTGVGLSYRFNDSCAISVTAQVRNYDIKLKKGFNIIIGGQNGINIPEGQSLVQEFTVTQGFPNEVSQAGFMVNNAFVSTNSNAYGMWLFRSGGGAWTKHSMHNPSKVTNATVSGTGYGAVSGVLATGNKVKLVYTPYTDDNNLGSMYIYVKFPSSDSYTTVASLTGFNSEAFRTNVFMGYRFVITDANVNGGDTELSFKGFTQYTVDSSLQGERSNVSYVVKDGIATSTRNDTNGEDGSNQYFSSITNELVSSSVLGLAESAVQYKDFAGDNDYTAYYTYGSMMTLPDSVYGSDKTVCRWLVDGVPYERGAKIFVYSDMTVLPVSLDFSMVGAYIRTASIAQNYGLRFGFDLDYEDYVALSELIDEDTEIITGTLIATADTLEGDLTLDTTTEKRNVVNNGFCNRTVTETAGTGEYRYYGSLVNIKWYNLARQFTGVGYITFTIGGKTCTVYTAERTYSIYEMAKLSYSGLDDEDKPIVKELYLDTVIEIENGTIVSVEGVSNDYSYADGVITSASGNMNVRVAIVDGVMKAVNPGTGAIIG